MRPNSFPSWRTILGMLGFTSMAIGVMAPSPAAAERVNNVVLVHGGFVDGGGPHPAAGQWLPDAGQDEVRCGLRWRRES